MTKSDAMKLAMMLGAYFPTPRADEDSLRAYARMLENYDAPLIERAIVRLVKTAKFFPRIAEILNAAAEETYRDDVLPTSEEAYEILLRAVRKYGGHRPFPNTIPHAGLIKRAVEQIGGWKYFCSESENLAADRARFIDAYDGVLKRERERVTLGIDPPRFDFKSAAQLDDEVQRKGLPPPATESLTEILERLKMPAAAPSHVDTRERRRRDDRPEPARSGT